MSQATQAIQLLETLTKAKIPKPAAKELIEYIDDTHSRAATRRDLDKTETGLKTEIENVRTGLKTEIENLRTGLKTEIENLRTGLEKTERNLKWLIALLFGGLLTLMLYLHNDTGKRMDRIETELKEIKTILLQNK